MMNCCLLLLSSLVICRVTEAVRVIGGNKTAVQGQGVSLPCRLTETDEVISQISWQKKTRKNPEKHNFFVISSEGQTHHVNGEGHRFSFIGSVQNNNGSLYLSNVSLLDEGVYTCIFTLFPSGGLGHKTEVHLTVIVPPVMSLKVEDHPLLGNKEVTFASCMAAGAKPPADVRWHTGSLAESVRAVTNSTQHANGTTTTVSYLDGVPTREVNHHSVECVVNHPGLTKEEPLPFLIAVYFSPMPVNITEASKDTFECVSEANPKASYSWSRVGQLWPESAVKAEGGTLQFLIFTADLNGLYVCQASNIYGGTSGHLYVHHTSGACTSCWVLFTIVFLTVIIGAGCGMWHKYRSGSPTRREETREELHHRPTSLPLRLSPKENLRVEEDDEGTW